METTVTSSVDERLLAILGTGRRALLEHEVYGLLREAGFDVPRLAFWEGEPAGEPPAVVEQLLRESPGGVVLKIVSPQILHKTDVGGLAFSAAEPAAMRAAARRVWEESGRRAPEAERLGVLVLERLDILKGSAAAELLVSLKQDPAFGPVLLFGIGGVLTEWFGELSKGNSTIVLQPGHVLDELESAARRLPAFRFLFAPSRQHPTPPLDLRRTAERLEALGVLACRLGAERGGAGRVTLEELEVNPVVLTADGRLVAADGKGRISARRASRPYRPLSKIQKLLAPRSAAVIGASATSVNAGRIILRNLKASDGIAYGHVYAVHPSAASIDGIPCYRLADLPEKVDLAVVSVPAEAARDAIVLLCERDLAEAIILIPGGFAETGRSQLQEEIQAALEASRKSPSEGPVLVGGNCLGIVSKRQYNTFFLPQYKLPFHDAPGDSLVAISQSGAYLVSLTSNLDGIVFPRASVSFGNQMDLTISDLLEFFEKDEMVRVLACYVEGFLPLDGERFVATARRLRAKGKHVIAFKAGKTELGAEAARSHTASLAGDYTVARSLMEQAGVLVAESLDMFEDYTKVFTLLGDRIPAGRRVAVLSNAGFECAAVLDKLYNLELAALSDETRERLARLLPDIAHADNPIDATPMATTAQFVAAAETLLADPGVDALIVSPIPVTPTLNLLSPDLVGSHQENIHSPGSLLLELLRVFAATPKPLVVNVDSGRLYDDFVILLQRGGIPVWRKIDRAARALSALCTG